MEEILSKPEEEQKETWEQPLNETILLLKMEDMIAEIKSLKAEMLTEKTEITEILEELPEEIAELLPEAEELPEAVISEIVPVPIPEPEPEPASEKKPSFWKFLF